MVDVVGKGAPEKKHWLSWLRLEKARASSEFMMAYNLKEEQWIYSLWRIYEQRKDTRLGFDVHNKIFQNYGEIYDKFPPS